jgi:XTP/dITP diphosphohydrolase
MKIRRGDSLLIATTNLDKLREIRALLAGVPLTVRALAPEYAHLPAPEETGETFAENARLKARYYGNATGLLTVADDSGLEIDALNGAPGVRSARYPGASWAERFENLYAELSASGHPLSPSSPSPARFVCAVAVAANGAIAFETRGTVEGEIAPQPRGQEGFGYDPILYYPPYGRTLGEVTPEEKARVSHRGVAFRQLRAFLERSLTD